MALGIIPTPAKLRADKIDYSICIGIFPAWVALRNLSPRKPETPGSRRIPRRSTLFTTSRRRSDSRRRSTTSARSSSKTITRRLEGRLFVHEKSHRRSRVCLLRRTPSPSRQLERHVTRTERAPVKPKIVERASDALAVSNRDPFPRREWRPAMTKAQCAVFQQQMNHARPVFHGRSVAFVADVCPPLPQPPPPQPKKPKPYFHRATLLRAVARIKSIGIVRKFCR